MATLDSSAPKIGATRRSSVEITQLAMWKQQQNLEEIKMLKKNNTINAKVPESPARNSSASPSHPKLSKLSARKLKNSVNGLKSSSTAATIPAGSAGSSVYSATSQPQPSKMMMMLNTNGIEPSNGNQVHAMSGTNSATNRQNDRSSVDQDNARIVAELRHNIEVLLHEKHHWLTRIHEDNRKMAKMLEDLKSVKLQFTKKMTELNYERAKIQTHQHQLKQTTATVNEGENVVGDEIDAYLLEECPLSQKYRSLTFSGADLSDAETLQQELLALTATFRSNQNDTLSYFYASLREAVNTFGEKAAANADADAAAATVPNTEVAPAKSSSLAESSTPVATGTHTSGSSLNAPAAAAIHQLMHQQEEARLRHLGCLKAVRALASSGAGNLQAAKQLSVSVADAVITAAGEHTIDLLETKQTAELKKQKDAQMEIILALKGENEKLRNNAAQLKKSNVQLRIKNAALAMHPARGVTHTAGNKYHRGDVSSNEAKGGLRDTGDGEVDPEGQGFPAGNEIHNAAEDGAVMAHSDMELGVVAANSNALHSETPDLPSTVESYINRRLTAHALVLLEGHPLATTVSDAVLQRLSMQITQEIKAITTAAFFAYFRHKLEMEIEELPECFFDGSTGEIPLNAQEEGTHEMNSTLTSEQRSVITMIKEAGEHVVRVGPVHTELTALSTLYLTYLHGRPAALSRPLDGIIGYTNGGTNMEEYGSPNSGRDFSNANETREYYNLQYEDGEALLPEQDDLINPDIREGHLQEQQPFISAEKGNAEDTMAVNNDEQYYTLSHGPLPGESVSSIGIAQQQQYESSQLPRYMQPTKKK